MSKDHSEPLDTDLTPHLWYTSRRFWGMAATVIQGLVMTFFGLDLTAEELDQFTTAGLGIGTAFAGIIGLWGSIRARGPLVFRKKTHKAITEKVVNARGGASNT